jgi:hypothetical protein
VDWLATCLQIALELSSPGADVVGALERLHTLHQRPLRGKHGFGERFGDRRHGGDYTSWRGAINPKMANLADAQVELEHCRARLREWVSFAGVFRTFLVDSAAAGPKSPQFAARAGRWSAKALMRVST